MKIIFALFFAVSLSFANYSIYYGDLKLGVIHNFNTIKENYLKIKVTSSLAKWLLGKKEVIYYNDQATIAHNDNNTKYKKDKYHIIDILKQSINNNLQDGKIHINNEKYLNIQKKKDYNFQYVSKGRVKSDGQIKIKDAKLISLIDDKNHVKIIKN